MPRHPKTKKRTPTPKPSSPAISFRRERLRRDAEETARIKAELAASLDEKLEALEDQVLEMGPRELLSLVTLLAEGLLQAEGFMRGKFVSLRSDVQVEVAWEELFENDLCEYAEAIEKLEEILE